LAGTLLGVKLLLLFLWLAVIFSLGEWPALGFLLCIPTTKETSWGKGFGVLSLLFASLSNNFPSDLLFARISSSLCRGSSGSFFVLIFLNIPEGLSLGDLSGGEPRALDNIFGERIENLLLLWGTGELGSSDLRESSMLNFASLWELPLSTAVGSRTNGSS
jgi:hypothetical protein